MTELQYKQFRAEYTTQESIDFLLRISIEASDELRIRIETRVQ